MDDGGIFAGWFSALTGHTPLKWQVRLFEQLKSGDIPTAVTLPTGLGKTSVIMLWLLALARSARLKGGRPRLARRLVYIVNRRTVVDQATADARRLLGCLYASGRRDRLSWAADEAITALALPLEPVFLDEHAVAVAQLRDALAGLSGNGPGAPLAISTLRGELADNGEWKQNPARPAIIIGTVDMIGSKLLFSGYGDGRYGRAHHAGLIGQDALIVHDEAHLSPAFEALLRAVATEQGRCNEARAVRVMSLSATTRAESSCGAVTDSVFGLQVDDRNDALVSQRLSATKLLRIVEAEKGKTGSEIAKAALTLGKIPTRVLVYVRSPDVAAEVAQLIEKGLGGAGDARVALLTGTIRGFERDALAAGTIMSAFWSKPGRQPLAQSVFLVSTSAGEVGADFDADHLVCDLTPLDSMVQRFGRVNRLGGGDREAQIVLVVQKQAEREQAVGDRQLSRGKSKAANAYDAAVTRTGELIGKIAADGGDVSPAALGKAIAALPDVEKRAAFSPEPTILPTTDILFDAWALTSITGKMPGRPEVEPYLHGIADWEPPETRLAWRADIALLAAAGGKDDNGAGVPCSHEELERVFEAFPLRAAEQLRDRTERVQAALRKIAERLRAESRPQAASTPVGSSTSEEHSATGSRNESGNDAVNRRQKPAELNPWVVLMRNGTVEWARLGDIAPSEKERRLAFATVVLPVEAGGLTRAGILDGSQKPEDGPPALDVAEMTGSGADRQRVRRSATAEPSSSADMNADNGEADKTTEWPLLGGEVVAALVPRLRVPLTAPAENEDASPSMLEYRVAKGEAREPGSAVPLDEHCHSVAAVAERMAKAVGLDGESIKATALAGKLHDLGKAREIWQRYARNQHAGATPLAKGATPLAKAEKGRYLHPKALGGYRHEFGSLHDAAANGEIQSLDAGVRDLVLHLIAAHHGWGRPHFEPRHFDPGDPDDPRPTAENERLAVEVMQRFARLQQRYGRWGLAWLESILRCADAEASESPAQPANAAEQLGDTPGGVS